MSIHKLLGSLSVGFVVAYIVCATVDTKYGVSARLASYLPG